MSDEDAYKYASYLGNVQLDDASFAKVYNKEENAGYEKEIVTSGPFRYIIFTRTSAADSFHPDFLCYVDYIGENKDAYVYCEKAEFRSITGEDYFATGSVGRDIRDISGGLLYIGNLDEGCTFYITLDLMDQDAEMKYDKASEQNPECEAQEYATEVSKVSIMVQK